MVMEYYYLLGITNDKKKSVFKNQSLINRIFEIETYLNSFMEIISDSHVTKIKRFNLKFKFNKLLSTYIFNKRKNIFKN